MVELPGNFSFIYCARIINYFLIFRAQFLQMQSPSVLFYMLTRLGSPPLVPRKVIRLCVDVQIYLWISGTVKGWEVVVLLVGFQL
jgi:hypothetical protein